MGMYLPENELIKYYNNLKFLKSEKIHKYLQKI